MRKFVALTAVLLAAPFMSAHAGQSQMYLLTYNYGSTKVAEFKTQPSWSKTTPTCPSYGSNCTSQFIDSLTDPSDSSSSVASSVDTISTARYISLTAAPWGITGTIDKCLTTPGCDASPYYAGAKIYVYDLNTQQLLVNGQNPLASTGNVTDCTFNWLEDQAQYSSYISPKRPSTQVVSPYTFRFYASSQSYLGVSSQDQHLYYVGSNGGMADLGLLSNFSGAAGCR